jgi:flagella basal body P-ring formation protein FlgA
VDVLVSGERAARAWARVETYRSRPVVVLTRDVRRGEVLGAEDVEVRGGEAPDGALGAPEDAAGRRAVRSLSVGTTLSARDLESVPAIGRGDAVLLVARVGAVVATAPGRALESAGVGDSVRVENTVSGQAVTGVLRDGGVVDLVR